jgi:hypothetical protein
VAAAVGSARAAAFRARWPRRFVRPAAAASMSLLLSPIAAATPTAAEHAAATPTAVEFSFVGEVARHSTLSGSGELKLADVPAPGRATTAVSGVGRGVLRLPRSDRSVQFTITGGSYRLHSIDQFGRLFQILSLHFRVVRSTTAACVVGQTGIIRIVHDEADRERDGISLQGVGGDTRCSFAALVSGNDSVRVAIKPSPRPRPAPTKFTLTVNETSVTQDFNAPDQPHAKIGSVDRATFSPEVSGRLNAPLPQGWDFFIYRPADPLSPGNGVYYTICHTKVGSTTCDLCPPTPAMLPPNTPWQTFYTEECGPQIIRPPANPSGAGGETIIAQLTNRTGGWKAADVDIVWKPG